MWIPRARVHNGSPELDGHRADHNLPQHLQERESQGLRLEVGREQRSTDCDLSLPPRLGSIEKRQERLGRIGEPPSPSGPAL